MTVDVGELSPLGQPKNMTARARVVENTWAVVVAADAYVLTLDTGDYNDREKLATLRAAVVAQRGALAILGLTTLYEESRLPSSMEDVMP